MKEMQEDLKTWKRLVKAAQGQLESDLLIRNTRMVNVITGKIQEETNISALDGKIAYVGKDMLPAKEIIDAKGKYAMPGFIDTHLHIESSQVTPPIFARAVLPHGTTCVAPDPHEIVNVGGIEAMKWMVTSGRGLPLKFCWMAPSSVPSTEGLETSGASFGGKEVEEILSWEDVVGVAEVMDYEGVLGLSQRMTEIIDAGKHHDAILDSHFVGPDSRKLCGYIAAGMDGCHESFYPDEVLEKLRAGMTNVKIRNLHVMSLNISPSQRADHVKTFVEKLNSIPDKRGIQFCTDDIPPDVLIKVGHMDGVLREVIREGYDPVSAIQGATIGPSLILRRKDLGSVTPGKCADILLAEDLNEMKISDVFADGIHVAQNGKLLKQFPAWEFPYEAKHSVKNGKEIMSSRGYPVEPENFKISAGKRTKAIVRVIDMDDVFTKFVVEKVPAEDGFLMPTEANLNTIAVIERHGINGNICLGLAKNALLKGAVASSIAHDSHNIAVIGMDISDMSIAVNRIYDLQGGVVVVSDQVIRAEHPLPVGGLMSEDPLEEVAERMSNVRQKLKVLGEDSGDFLKVWTIALPVIPHARITDKYLVDVDKQKPVSLFV